MEIPRPGALHPEGPRVPRARRSPPWSPARGPTNPKGNPNQNRQTLGETFKETLGLHPEGPRVPRVRRSPPWSPARAASARRRGARCRSTRPRPRSRPSARERTRTSENLVRHLFFWINARCSLGYGARLKPLDLHHNFVSARVRAHSLTSIRNAPLKNPSKLAAPALLRHADVVAGELVRDLVVLELLREVRPGRGGGARLHVPADDRAAAVVPRGPEGGRREGRAQTPPQ